MNSSCGSIVSSLITPGIGAARAMKPPLDGAVYSVRNSWPPPTARLIELRKPPLPPEPKRVDVSSAMPCEYQPTSPPSVVSVSPLASVISRTGMVVPTIRVSMVRHRSSGA